ncbi:MAG: marine proteobacterial sortase target protein [Pseudomonadota bacterium]
MTHHHRRPSASSQLSLVLAAIFFAATLFLFSTAQAMTPETEADADEAALREAGLVRLSDIADGALLLNSSEPGWYVPAPRLATDVKMEVSGPIVRAVVTQRFENPSEGWVEGRYLFPLPEDAGVDALRMLIGERIIEGEIRERAEARRVYEAARAAGQRASLVEQERPNMFTTSVANIGPGETIVIQIEYQGVARMRGGEFELRFPMVVAPRFNPDPSPLIFVRSGGTEGDPVPDRERITAPVTHPDAEPEEAPRLPVNIEIDLKAGFALGEIESLHHAVAIDRSETGQAVITFADGRVPADRDFVLTWSAAQRDTPQIALFEETVDGQSYLLAMIAPPAELGANAPRRERETIFVIDNSGSMAGGSIEQARAALVLALERLEPGDTFNVVRFDDTFDVLFPDAVPADARHVDQAVKWVSRLQAEGGTQMLPAMRAALTDPVRDVTRVRQVVFLTDGAIGNEAQLFSAIDAELGASRLFPVGIGSAPNSYFMSRAARIGRGRFTHIGDLSEVSEEMAALFEALERPVMTDMDALFEEGALTEIWPAPLPDLYFGEPVVLTARADDPVARMILEGQLAEAGWRQEISLADAVEASGVAQLWARNKIAGLEELRFQGASVQTIDRQVLATALQFGLVTRLTSLVAVDREPARPDDAPLASRDIPLMLPDGWEFDAVFGEAAAAPAPPPPAMMQRLAFTPDVNGTPAPAAQTPGMALPATATPALMKLIAGLVLMLLGAAVLIGLHRVRATVKA